MVNFIDRQLCGPYQPLQETYRYGLRAVDRTSESTYGKVFADLESPEQIELLRRLEDGKTAGAANRGLPGPAGGRGEAAAVLAAGGLPDDAEAGIRAQDTEPRLPGLRPTARMPRIRPPSWRS